MIEDGKPRKYIITLTHTIPGTNDISFNDFQVEREIFKKVCRDVGSSNVLWQQDGYIEREKNTIWKRLLPKIDELEYQKQDPFLKRLKTWRIL